MKRDQSIQKAYTKEINLSTKAVVSKKLYNRARSKQIQY